MNDQTANLVVAQLLFLESENPDKDISFYINSPGGSVSAGMAIFDTMNFIKPGMFPLCVLVWPQAWVHFCWLQVPKASVFHSPNSKVMIHQPSGGSQGQATEIEIASEKFLRPVNNLTKSLRNALASL